jgi:hydroxymethylbilane synthase
VKDLRVGTRGSPLALWQANEVAARIRQTGGPACQIVVIKTSGDRLQDAPLSEAGGKRLFVKEIEDALLSGDVDMAVHSSKDMPAVLPQGLTIGAVLPREDPLDAVVLPQHVSLNANAELGDASVMPEASAVSRTVDRIDQLFALLGEAPVIGTGSVRRVAQLKRLFPHARFKQIRGNLDTRLRKLDNGEYDAVILAAAGLRRLGLASRIALRIPAPSCLPAPGQGIVAIEIREGDDDVRRAVEPINDAVTSAALQAERAVVETLGGGCQTPVGALVSPGYPDEIELLAVVVSLDGSRAIYGMAHGMRDEAAAIGARVGAQLLADGAGEILAEAGRAMGTVEGTQP